MSVLIPIKITVALLPPALILLEVIAVPVKLDIQEMGTHVVVSLLFMC